MGLTNYILTCEKDNERLKYELSYYKGYSKRLKEKNTKYKEVIDKAIEYIDNNVLYECNYEEDDELPMISDELAKNALLNILKEVE